MQIIIVIVFLVGWFFVRKYEVEGMIKGCGLILESEVGGDCLKYSSIVVCVGSQEKLDKYIKIVKIFLLVLVGLDQISD